MASSGGVPVLSYLLPGSNTSVELERLEVQHRMWLLSLDNRLHIAPNASLSGPVSVLDIGCGSGLWALAFAARHSDSRVVGVDLTPPKTSPSAPSNCTFDGADLEQEAWPFEPGSFDFIHARLLTCGIRDWAKLIARCWAHLKPGGWLEIADPTFQPRSEKEGSSSASEPKAWLEWYSKYRAGASSRGIDIAASEHQAQRLENQGFVQISRELFRWPLGAWSSQQREKELGELALKDYLGLLEGASRTNMMQQIPGMTAEEVADLTNAARKDLAESSAAKQYCQYMAVHIAQKPGDGVGE